MPEKQPFGTFNVNDRVECTEQVSHYYGRHGIVIEKGPNRTRGLGKWMLRVRYDDGSEDRFDCTRSKTKRIWLRKAN